MVEVIGAIGSLIICLSGIPQVIKTYRTKSAEDLSITYLMMLMAGLCLLHVYCLYVRDLVFIFGNTLSLATTALLIVCWLRYRKRPPIETYTRIPDSAALAEKGLVR